MKKKIALVLIIMFLGVSVNNWFIEKHNFDIHGNIVYFTKEFISAIKTDTKENVNTNKELVKIENNTKIKKEENKEEEELNLDLSVLFAE